MENKPHSEAINNGRGVQLRRSGHEAVRLVCCAVRMCMRAIVGTADSRHAAINGRTTPCIQRQLTRGATSHACDASKQPRIDLHRRRKCPATQPRALHTKSHARSLGPLQHQHQRDAQATSSPPVST